MVPGGFRHFRTTLGPMFILGVICLVVGFVLAIHWLWIIGIVLAVLGAVLWLLGSERVGRRYY